MAEKRRDNKRRLLRQGELQRNDGKYEYRYIDAGGERRSVYSWRLVSTDKLPAGRHACEALRDLEKAIQKDLDDGIDIFAAQRTTVNQFFDEYIETKHALKESTRTSYKYMYDRYVRGGFGNKILSSVKFSDVKKFYTTLIKDTGLKPSSMEIVHSVLCPIFKTAVRDCIIRLDPTNGVIADMKKTINWETSKRSALTEPQQASFVSYIKSSGEYFIYLTMFTLFLGTGCRVSEISGLRWQDCDFTNGIITIDHSLIYRQFEDGNARYSISSPKTKAGTRIIPMLSEVKDALLDERFRQMQTGFNNSVIDGCSGFIFSTGRGNCITSQFVNRTIDRIVQDYNSNEETLANKQHRKANLLPSFSVHNLRHTFCTRFCENETNLKVIQEIMGHADISTTMNIYNEATKEKKLESFVNLEGKMKIG